MTPYEQGKELGRYKRLHPEVDARWDFADAAKAGVYHEFKRGFDDGYAEAEVTDE